MTIGGAMLNITDRADDGVGLRLYQGLDHFGLHTSDFDATIASLREKGVSFFIEPHSPKPGIQIAFVSGPDDVKVEILQVTPA